MTTYARVDVVRTARDLGVTPNSHILGRKDVHYNIVRNFLRSVYNDPEKEQYFMKCLKRSRQGRK